MFNIYKYIKYLIFHTREIYLNTQDSFLAIHFHLTKPRLGSCQIAFHSRIFLTFVEFHLYYCKTICYYDLFCLVILGSPWIWTYDSWFLGHHGCGHNDSWLLGHHGCGHMIVEFGVTMGKIIWLLNLWSPWATSYNCWIYISFLWSFAITTKVCQLFSSLYRNLIFDFHLYSGCLHE